jgi:hypothetical protein
MHVGRLLTEHCRRHGASYETRQAVELVSALPKNAYGTVLERERRDRDWTGRERQV